MVGVNVQSENCPEPLSEQKRVKITQVLKIRYIYDQSDSTSASNRKSMQFLDNKSRLFSFS